MKIIKVEHRSLPESQTAYLFVRSAGARVIPRTKNQVMVLLGRSVSILHVFAVIRHRAWLVAIIVAGDGQNGNVHFRVLIVCGRHRLPIVVIGRMLQPLLKNGARVSHDSIEGIEGGLLYK